MKNSLLTILLCVSGFTTVQAQEINYAVSGIPDSLLIHAHAVVRYFEANYDISGPEEYTLTEKIAVTILDEKGQAMGDMTAYYGHQQNTIESISGTLYDKNGKELKSLKKKDIIDAAAFGDMFVSDYRVKHHSFQTQNYPYTTEYETVRKFTSTLNLETWMPQVGYHSSSELSKVTIEYPVNFPLRYQAVKLPAQPTIKTDGNKRTLSLSLTGVKAVSEGNDFLTPQERQLPMLLLVSDTFSLVDHPGNLASWEAFGRFNYKLNEGRDVLSNDMKNTVHKLTDTCTNSIDKIVLLYQFLQQNTRYVSIQLGIGGWQTFDALFVSQKKYGDCKALTNFMKAMLKEAGITSFAATVRAGDEGYLTMDDKFPFSIFNHVILCVPQKADTNWLECTSQSHPAGYLGGFTANRKVLLNTPDGGRVVKTPYYGKESNVCTRKATLKVGEKDNLTGNVNYHSKGLFWDKDYGNVVSAVKSEADKYLNTMLGFSNYKVINSSVNNKARLGVPSLSVDMNVDATTEVTRSGNNLVLSTGAFPLQGPITTGPDTTYKEFQLKEDFIITDTLVFNLDGDYTLSKNTKEVNCHDAYGSYELHYQLINKNTLIKTSVYSINKGIYPMSEFKTYKKFRNEAYASSKSKVILTKL